MTTTRDITDIRSRELRIAPVMTGGSSLVVWMGGATTEIYRMVRSLDDEQGCEIYRRLLLLTETKPRVDVITGTSAGGINGTFLAAALAWHVPVAEFERVRELWMRAADLSRLCWQPRADGSSAKPRSLLDADEALTPLLHETLERWLARHVSTSAVPEVDLVTTFTAIRARRRALFDDFRERMDEEVYAGVLHHRTQDFVTRCEPGNSGRRHELAVCRGMPARLAWGARVSSALPAVFEPVYLPASPKEALDAKAPDFGDRIRVGGVPVRHGVWALDGGVVNNQPLGEALERIFDHSADGPVRRVVLYLSPTPQPPADPDEQAEKRASLRDGVSTIFTASRAQGIAADLDVLRAHNRAVRRQRSTRASLGLLSSVGIDFASQSLRDNHALMDVFRCARVEDSVDRTMSRLEQLVVDEEQADLRRADPGSAELPVDRNAIRAALVKVRAQPQFLPSQLPDPEQVRSQTWAWGIIPIEQAVSTTLGLINRTLALSPPPSQAATPLVSAWGHVLDAKTAAHEVRSELQQVIALDRSYWDAALRPLLKPHSPVELAALAQQAYECWPGADRVATLDRLRSLMERAAQTLVDSREHLDTLLDQAAASATSDVEQVRGELQALVPQADRDVVMTALLGSHVVQIAILGNVVAREQPVELLQLSWNSPDHLTNRAPAAKLVGDTAWRLGAFLLPSWRANDFLWGELDAAPRLIGMLLDPARLSQLGLTAVETLDALEVEHTPELTDELAFLDHPSKPVPRWLPRLTKELASRRQIEIARAGLGHVRSALDDTARRGGVLMPPAQEFIDRFDRAKKADPTLPDAEVTALLTHMRIGEEGLDEQLRGSLVTGYIGQVLDTTADLTDDLARGPYRWALKPLQLIVEGLGGFERAAALWRRRTRSHPKDLAGPAPRVRPVAGVSRHHLRRADRI